MKINLKYKIPFNKEQQGFSEFNRNYLVIIDYTDRDNEDEFEYYSRISIFDLNTLDLKIFKPNINAYKNYKDVSRGTCILTDEFNILIADTYLYEINFNDFTLNKIIEENDFCALSKTDRRNIFLIHPRYEHKESYLFDYNTKNIVRKIESIPQDIYFKNTFSTNKNKDFDELFQTNLLLHKDNFDVFSVRKDGVYLVKDNKIYEFYTTYDNSIGYIDRGVNDVFFNEKYLSYLTDDFGDWLCYYDNPPPPTIITWDRETKKIISEVFEPDLNERFDIFQGLYRIKYSKSAKYIILTYLDDIGTQKSFNAIYELQTGKRVLFNFGAEFSYFNEELNQLGFYDPEDKYYKIYELVEE